MRTLPLRQSMGSSPHTRGALRRDTSRRSASWNHPRIRREHPVEHDHDLADPGIIPAYAGSTYNRSNNALCIQGSSPHTWGARRAAASAPAYRRDHPRIRGEHQGHPERPHGHQGIIPAYAGNTNPSKQFVILSEGSSPHTRGTPASTAATPRSAWDHPRIRGEHDGPSGRAGAGPGIIPAYAGNTHPAFHPLCRDGDHPRIRGEHPPRRVLDANLPGIIPAYAGNTPTRAASTAVTRGSSPHTRGTPCPCDGTHRQ